MKMLTFSVATLLAVAGFVNHASAAVKAYELEWGTAPLTVDADFSDWKRLDWRDDFSVVRGHGKTAGTARFALMRDRTNLYVAFRYDGRYRASEAHVRHDGDIWKGNSVVEIFIARPGTAAGYVQFSLAANGDRQDAADGDGFVTPDWEAVTKRDAEGWQAEVRIPFKEADLSLDQLTQYEFRMNVCLGLEKLSVHDDPGSLVWSTDGGPGYRNVADMGFVVHDDFRAGCDRAKAILKRERGFDSAQQTVRIGDEAGYLAFKAALSAEIEALNAERMKKVTEKLSVAKDLPVILAQDWADDRRFDRTMDLQAEMVDNALAQAGDRHVLSFVGAVNETIHRPFVLTAQRKVDDLEFACSDLKGTDGAVIPKSALYVARFAFLEPDPRIRKKPEKPLNLGYPEIVERLEKGDRQALEGGESRLFRLYVSTRGVKPGNYRGVLAARSCGEFAKFDVELEVQPIELPLAETRPFPVYLFTTIPWGGESAECWAQFFNDYYNSDVSFENPDVYERGELAKPYPGDQRHGWGTYIEKMSATNPIPAAADVRVDLKAFALDERLAACARHNLRVIMSNRSGFVKTEHFPALLAAFGTCGLKPSDVIYKLGDEDPSLLFLPVAKRLREVVPEMRTIMIPSGTSYWDMKPALEGFTDFTYSRASFKMGPEGDKDLKYLQSKGVVLSRYINNASWAGRTLPIAARQEPWDALIVDGANGYCCWTASLRPDCRYAAPYGAFNWDFPLYDQPPERQDASFLVYIRKRGEVYYPVSCIRLENIRDGLVDALYFRLAKQACEKRGDTEGLRKVAAFRTSQKRTIADYEAARRMLSAIILGR